MLLQASSNGWQACWESDAEIIVHKVSKWHSACQTALQLYIPTAVISYMPSSILYAAPGLDAVSTAIIDAVV